MLPLRPLLAERRRSTWFMVRFGAWAAYGQKRLVASLRSLRLRGLGSIASLAADWR